MCEEGVFSNHEPQLTDASENTTAILKRHVLHSYVRTINTHDTLHPQLHPPQK